MCNKEPSIWDNADAERRFKDLFGKEELEEVRTKYFAERKTNKMQYKEFLEQETERKLRKQDGEIGE